MGEQDAKIFNVENCRICQQQNNNGFDPNQLQQAQKADLQMNADELKKGTIRYKEYTAIPLAEQESAMAEQNTDSANPAIAPPSGVGGLYFYHPDHLGTSTALTDYFGKAYQFFLNLPFGETMAQQLGSNYYNSPYKFNGKELDEETGLYYYGARYYSPRESIWLSVDPLTEEFPDVSPYCYTLDNPINLIDPDGKAPTDIIIFGANKSSITIKTNLVDISVNASSLGVDFVGNYSLSGGDIIQAAVDIAGVFDPTPTSDILGAKLSADSGDWWGATASVLGAALPYAGDIAKGPKIAKGLDKISDAIKAVNGNSKASEKAQHIYGLINKETGLIEKVGISGGKITKDGEKSYRATKQLKELNKNGEKYTQKILDNVPAGKGAREKALSLEKKYTNANRASINPKLHNRPKPE